MRKRRFNTAVAAAVLATALMVGGCGGNGQEVTTGAAESQAATAEAAESSTEETSKPETSAAAAEKEAAEETQITAKQEATDADYLKEWFGVELSDKAFDPKAFSAALKQVAGEDAPVIEGKADVVFWSSAVQAAIVAADYEELAMGYPHEKVIARLNGHGTEVPEQEADKFYMTNIACALDVGLITGEEVTRWMAGDIFDAADAEKLLMNIARANGDARNYLGMASDPDIYGKVDQAWNSFIIFDDGKLAEVGKEAVMQQISTGYGIKSAAFAARFLPDLTLQYGHSDIKHAHQLLGLLNSEDIDAKVQLEPKISIYQYLLEWGPVPEATPTYEVKQFDDLYLVYAVEYDLQLEFNNTEDMMRFDSVIKAYAKKNEGNEDADGLIYESWWQPLYSTTRTDMPEADYHQMFDCVVTNGIYSIHPFALPENQEKMVEKLTELADGLEVTPVERYCNTAFHSYLKGEDYQ